MKIQGRPNTVTPRGQEGERVSLYMIKELRDEYRGYAKTLNSLGSPYGSFCALVRHILRRSGEYVRGMITSERKRIDDEKAGEIADLEAELRAARDRK